MYCLAVSVHLAGSQAGQEHRGSRGKPERSPPRGENTKVWMYTAQTDGYILKHHGAQAHTFEKPFVSLLGIYVGISLTLAVIWQSLCAVNLEKKNTHRKPISLIGPRRQAMSEAAASDNRQPVHGKSGVTIFSQSLGVCSVSRQKFRV